MMRMLPIENYSGCLFGGAIGDALGAPVECMDVEAIRNCYGQTGISDYVEHPGNIGEFTDDTQMTLFTAEGLLRSEHRAILKGIGGAAVSITYQSYLRWLHTQGYSLSKEAANTTDQINSGWLINERELFKHRAPGSTCIQSLQTESSHFTEFARNKSKGCGALMRMAPVGLFCRRHEDAFNLGIDFGKLTHGHPSGYLSAGFFASLVQRLTQANSLAESISLSTELLVKYENHEEVLHAVIKAVDIAKKIDPGNNLRDQVENGIGILGQGWIAEEALSISILCALVFEHDFVNGIIAAVNHSGDSDSTGSVTGNILGLINGLQGIPDRWVKNLKSAQIVNQIAEDLFIGCKSDSLNMDSDWWNKYPGY